MRFFVGLHHPSDAHRFPCCMVSVAALRKRKSDFRVNDWIMDSGAFMELKIHGRYRDSTDVYAEQINRWSRCGNMLAAVSQDYMCEPFILDKTSLTTKDHQLLTIQRYDSIRNKTSAYVMPVLQGYWPEEYVRHIRNYGWRLAEGQWTGVGSVCKRNADIHAIEQVLMAIKRERPDLKLHGFGVKLTALQSSIVRDCLHSADSMAWSFAARREGRNGNSHLEAASFVDRINGQTVRQRDFQPLLF